MIEKENCAKNVEEKCVDGCKHYTGGEIKHHKDCPYYTESLSKMYDDTNLRNALRHFLRKHIVS